MRCILSILFVGPKRNSKHPVWGSLTNIGSPLLQLHFPTQSLVQPVQAVFNAEPSPLMVSSPIGGTVTITPGNQFSRKLISRFHALVSCPTAPERHAGHREPSNEKDDLEVQGLQFLNKRSGSSCRRFRNSCKKEQLLGEGPQRLKNMWL